MIVHTRRQIAAEAAQGIVTRAVAHARANGWDVCAAVADPRGALVALLRTDDVIDPAIDFAIDKAYTAATLGTSTEAFFERADSRPALKLGLTNRSRILVFPGGVPIYSDGVCIGGLGVSGAEDHQDVACAKLAIEAAGFQTDG